MEVKRMRMFAGLNGSGKFTLIQALKEQFNWGYLINGDDIEAQLVKAKLFG